MDKSASVEDYILTSIRQQRWKQGEKMPPEPEMCRELGVSKTTLRIALKTLANRGVIERRRGAGSYVTKDLRANKVIIFVNFESLALPSGFIYRTLVTRLKERIAAAGLTPVLGIASGATREEFFRDIQFERRDDIDEIVGAISLIACLPSIRRLMCKHRIPLLEMSGTGYGDEAPEQDGNYIFLDSKSTIRTGLEAFDRAGIRDFAVFFISSGAEGDSGNADFFRRQLEERGIATDEKHLIDLPWSWDRREAYDEFLRWWELPGRPSAVFFAEDNICKEALHAIWELGIKIPQQLSIVTQSSGEKFHSPAELTMTAYDTGAIAGTLFDTLEQMRAGAVPEFPRWIKSTLISGHSLASPHAARSGNGNGGIEIAERLVYRDRPLRSGFGCWKSETGYCFTTGAEMFEVNSDVSGNDRYDCFTERFSADHGENWGPGREVFTSLASGDNVHRYCELFQNLDINSNSIYRLYLEGTYENDSDVWAGINSFRRNFRLLARRSFDGGRNFSEPEDLTRLYQGLQPGGGRPLVSCSHLFPLSDGSIVIPVSIDPAPGREGMVRMLHGRGSRNGGCTGTVWSVSEPIRFATRFDDLQLTEGSVIELPDGRLAAVYRADSFTAHGGNARWNKFLTVSEDGGRNWSPAAPLLHNDGSEVCSPCSMPRLWLHSSGKVFFIGNIWPRQVELMRSRNVLSIAEINPDTLRVKPETVTAIDGHGNGDHPYLALSNFTVTEDRRNGDILVFCPKAYTRKFELPDCVLMRYRIRIDHD